MKKKIIALALGIMVAFAANSYAQEPQKNQAPSQADKTLTRLMTVVTHKAMASRATQLLVHDEKRYTPSCEKISRVQPAEITVFEEPKFNDAGLPLSGHWMVRFEVDVCDRPMLRSIDYHSNGEQIGMASLLPGNTKGDPMLQKDVTKTFKMAVMKAYPSCTNPFVADTRLLSMPKNGDAPWEELWVMNACGNSFGQSVRFVPQESGTAFSLEIPTGQ